MGRVQRSNENYPRGRLSENPCRVEGHAWEKLMLCLPWRSTSRIICNVSIESWPNISVIVDVARHFTWPARSSFNYTIKFSRSQGKSGGRMGNRLQGKMRRGIHLFPVDRYPPSPSSPFGGASHSTQWILGGSFREN